MDDNTGPKHVPFGRYELQRRLATGGMGEVYLATMRGAAGFQKRVVIKRILPELSRNPEFVSRFIEEGKLVGQLAHANIVGLLELGEVAGEYYLAMEHVDGVDLRELLRVLAARGELMPVDLALHVVTQIAAGLSYAHRKTDEDGRPLGIIHRDISTSNIMVSHEGAVRILDFGVAKAAARLDHSVTGTLKGKFLYMSPEQARGSRLDQRSDLFSLGAVAYELITGVRPFAAETDLGVLERVKKAAPADIRTLRPEISAPVADVVHRCLAVTPVARFQSAADLLEAIRERLQDLSETAFETRLAEFVRDLFPASAGETVQDDAGDEAPRSPGLGVDDLLAVQLQQASQGHPSAGEEPSGEPPSRATVSTFPTPKSERDSVSRQSQISGEAGAGRGKSVNSILFLGLLAIIAVLLFFNIRNVLEPRTFPRQPVDPPANLAPSRPQSPPVTDSDLAPLPDGVPDDMPEAPSPIAAASPATPDVTMPEEHALTPPRPAPAPTPPAEEPLRATRLSGLANGARVFVNDSPVTPGEDDTLLLPARGPLEIEVRKPHHEVFTLQVEENQSVPDEVKISMAPLRHSVTVESSPPGAELSFDGRPVGFAPRRAWLSPGTRIEVRAELDGHHDTTETLRFGGPSVVELRLAPHEPGMVSFRFFPSDAVVKIDGRRLETGQSNLVEHSLPPGEHNMVLQSLDGALELKRSFVVRSGETVRLGTMDLTEGN